MKAKPWKLLKQTDVGPSKWFPVLRRDFELPDKTTIDYYVGDMGKVGSVLPFHEGKFYFAKQYRPGLMGFTLEPFAGCQDEGESVLDAAKRELLEESGMSFRNHLPLCTHTTSAAKNTEEITTYLGTDLISFATQKGGDRDEIIEIVSISVGDCVKLIKEEEIDGVELGWVRNSPFISAVSSCIVRYPDIIGLLK